MESMADLQPRYGPEHRQGIPGRAVFPGRSGKLENKPRGQGLGKKWRLEFSSLQKDGEASRPISWWNRWMPDRIVGRFRARPGPPQIIDANGINRLSWRIFPQGYPQRVFIHRRLLLALQIFWLYRMHSRGSFQKSRWALPGLPGSRSSPDLFDFGSSSGVHAGLCAGLCFPGPGGAVPEERRKWPGKK